MMTTLFGEVDGVLGLVMAWYAVLMLILTLLGPALIAACLCGGEGAEVENAPVERLAALVVAIEQAQLMRPAVPPAPVVELGHFPYSGSGEGRRASEKLVCAICLEEFQQGYAGSEVPACRHLFHRDCIDAWMKSNTTCPLCRRSIMVGSEPVSLADDMV